MAKVPQLKVNSWAHHAGGAFIIDLAQGSQMSNGTLEGEYLRYSALTDPNANDHPAFAWVKKRREERGGSIPLIDTQL